MKLSKKIIALFLVIAILSSFSVTAFAAPSDGWTVHNWDTTNGVLLHGVAYYSYTGSSLAKTIVNGIKDLLSVDYVGAGSSLLNGFDLTKSQRIVREYLTYSTFDGVSLFVNSVGATFKSSTIVSDDAGYLASKSIVKVGYEDLCSIAVALISCGFNVRVVKRALYVLSDSDATTVYGYVISGWEDTGVYTNCLATLSGNALVDDIFFVNRNYNILYAPLNDPGTSLNTPYDTYTKPSQDPTTSTDGDGHIVIEHHYDQGDTLHEILNEHNYDYSTDYNNCTLITLEDGSQLLYDYRSGEFVNVENVEYSPVDNTYYLEYTYNDDSSYEEDNSVVYHTYVTYNITNITYTYIGESAEYEIYEVYYKLPDGRSSADLTVEELEQLSLNFDVINYGVSADDGRLRALYHFDGNTEDSSYWSNYGGFDWVSGASITYLEANNFNGCLYLDEDDHAFDVTLPSNAASSDFSIFFRYYHSGTDTVATDFTLDFGEYNLFTATTGNTTTANVPVGNWVEIALIRSGSTLYTYQNGIVTSSTAVSEVFGNTLSFTFTAGSTYRYFDELRVFNFAVYDAGEDYTPTTVPADTNAVLVLPDEGYAIPDAYWDFDTYGNLLSQPDFTQGASVGICDVATTNGTAQYYNVASSIGKSTLLYDSYFHSLSVFDTYITLYSPDSYVEFGELGSPLTNNYYFSGSQGFYIPLYCYRGMSSPRIYDRGLVSGETYTFSLISSDGSSYSHTFVYEPLSDEGSVSSFTEFDWGGLSYFYFYDNPGWKCYGGFVVIQPTTPIDIVYMELVEGDTPNTGHKYVTEIYSSEELTGPMIAVRSQIPINTYRVGGVRPTLPYRGDVWLMVEDARITSCQIYTGILWQEVDCRIWTGSAWRSPVYYDVITLQDMFDVNGTTDNVYIESEEGYYSWITVQFDELLSILNTISDQIEKIDTSGGGGSGDVYIDLTFTDNGGITINFVQLTDTSRDGMLDVFAVLYDIFFSDALDELAGSLDNIASAYDKGGGQISGDGEKDYGVFSIFSDEVVWT